MTTEDRGGVVLLAIPALALLVLFVRTGGITVWPDLAGLARVGAGLVAVLAGLVVLAGIGRAGSGRRRLHGHGHGGDRPTIARHEAGHAAAARAVGGRVTSAVMYSGERGGLVQARIPDGPLPAVTFLMAGEIAAGTSRGTAGDRAAIRKELRGLSGSDAARVRRTATRDARRIVRRAAGRIDSDARTLERKGRL